MPRQRHVGSARKRGANARRSLFGRGCNPGRTVFHFLNFSSTGVDNSDWAKPTFFLRSNVHIYLMHASMRSNVHPPTYTITLQPHASSNVHMYLMHAWYVNARQRSHKLLPSNFMHEKQHSHLNDFLEQSAVSSALQHLKNGPAGVASPGRAK